MQMKILFDLQLSSFDVLGKCRFASDSNYIFLSGLLESIDKMYECMVLLPYQIRGQENIGGKHYWINYESDYYSARFNFDWPIILGIIGNEAPDLVWTNNPIWVPFYKAVFRKLNKKIPIVSYNHWIDLPNTRKESDEYSLEYLQIAGMLASDAILVNSQWGSKLIREGISLSIKGKFDKKIVAFPPPLRKVLQTTNIGHYCIYNHRISGHPYYKEALEKLKLLMEGLNILVIFTNPSGKEPISNLSFQNQFVHLEWDEYLRLLSKAYCSVSTSIDPGAQWSMSIVESIASGIPTLIPRAYGYKEILPQNYPLYYRDIAEAKEKLKALLNNRIDIAYYVNFVNNEYGKEKTAQRFQKLLEEIT